MEYIDIYDENNNSIGETKEKARAHEDGNFHRTAHIWIINDKNELLLQKRSASKKSHPNCWDISSAGHIRAGEDVITGAIRELKEELGVEVQEKDFEYVVTIKNTNNPKNMEFQYVYLLHSNKEIKEYVFEDDEVSEVKYVYYKDLERMVEEKEEGLLIHNEEYKELFQYIRKFKEDNMQLRFEKITKDNIELAVKVQNTIFPEEDGRENYVECVNKDPYRRELTFWIVYDGGEPIGVSGLYSYNEYKDDAWLGWFGVLPYKRNKGYGLKMLEHFENYAREKGYKAIRLYTDEISNKDAIKLYTKRGMISEKYNNENEDKEVIKTTLIFSKSLTNEPVQKWNDKYLGLTEQSNKEKEGHNS